MNNFQSRRVNRVATKIAQEIRVLFEHDDVHTGAREQKPEHHARRSAARDAATGGKRFIHSIRQSAIDGRVGCIEYLDFRLLPLAAEWRKQFDDRAKSLSPD